MKRTLALLIAVLMVMAMLPLSTLAASQQALVGAPAPEQSAAVESQMPPASVEEAQDATDVNVGYLSGASGNAAPAAGTVPFALPQDVPSPDDNVQGAVELWNGETLAGAYDSISQALSAAATSGSTLKLLYDHAESGTIQSSGKSWTLDGNGKKLYVSGGITIKGNTAATVEIKNLKLYTDQNGINVNSGKANVTVDGVVVFPGYNTTGTVAAFLVKKGDKLVIKGNSGAVVDAQGRGTVRAIYNDGTLEILDGTFRALGAVVLVNSGEADVRGGWFESDARCVARTMSKGTLRVHGGTMVLNAPAAAEDIYRDAAVITNSDGASYGNVYIFGGQFRNNNDGTVLGTEKVYSRQVLAQTHANGNFQIFGGIMLATAVQDFFFAAASDANGTGISAPVASMPILKGQSPKCEVDGREYYYAAYSVGDSLVVPDARCEVAVTPAEGSTPASVDMVFTATLDAIHYNTLQTWARVKASEFNSGTTQMDNYTLAYGLVLTTLEGLRKSNGSARVEDLEKAEAYYRDVPADGVLNADGSLDFSLRVEDIPAADSDVQYLVIPYVELTLGVGTAQQTDAQRYYGGYDSNNVASLEDAAQAILRDNLDVQTDAYRYPSITVNGAFNRYTEAQQNVLKEYLPHRHDFDYKGECRIAGCDAGVAVALADGGKVTVFAETDSLDFFALTLKKDVTYILAFAKDFVTYKLYNENGAVCTVSNGVLTVAEDGTYYLRVQGERSGSTEMTLSHIHDANHLGECEVCCDEGETLSVELFVDEKQEPSFTKNNFYFYNVALEAGISYTVKTMNGIARLFDAEGNEQTFVNGKFACAAAGTYYVVVEGIYSGKGSICVAHVHEYDYKGDCKVQGCGDCVLTAIDNIYDRMPPKAVVSGITLHYAINLMADQTYSIKTNRYFGTFRLCDAAGNEIELINDSFTCEADGVYYLTVNVDVYVNNAQLYFAVEHECAYNYKGVCELEHVNADGEPEKVTCGQINLVRLYDGEPKDMMVQPGKSYAFLFDYAGKGITYVIELPKEGVTYKLYDVDGNEIQAVSVETPQDAEKTADEYESTLANKTLYVVVTCTAEEDVALQLKVSHKHVIGYTGACTVTDTTQDQPCMHNEAQELVLETENAVEFEANGAYYYELKLEANKAYKVTFAGCPDITWLIKESDGDDVALVGDGSDVIITVRGGTYYLIVTAAADSEGTPEAPATVKVERAPEMDPDPDSIMPETGADGDTVQALNHVAAVTYGGVTYYYTTFDAAVTAALEKGSGEIEITVLEDADWNAQATINKSLTIKGASKDVVLTGKAASHNLKGASTLTFQNLTVNATPNWFDIANSSTDTVNLTFDNVTVNITKVSSPNLIYLSRISINITITDCEFNFSGDTVNIFNADSGATIGELTVSNTAINGASIKLFNVVGGSGICPNGVGVLENVTSDATALITAGAGTSNISVVGGSIVNGSITGVTITGNTPS